MSNLKRKYKGFTLVELLVVISIIALLLAILMPSLNKAREQAYYIPCGANLRAFHIGFMLYAEDNNQMTIPGRNWNLGERSIVRKTIDSYFKSPKSWRCPADNRGRVYTKFEGASYYYDWYTLSRVYGNTMKSKSRKLLEFNRTADTYLFGHQWIYDGTVIPPDFNTGAGIYWPHKHLKGASARGCFSVFLDGHCQRKTWVQDRADAAKMAKYYKIN